MFGSAEIWFDIDQYDDNKVEEFADLSLWMYLLAVAGNVVLVHTSRHLWLYIVALHMLDLTIHVPNLRIFASNMTLDAPSTAPTIAIFRYMGYPVVHTNPDTNP